MESEEATGGGMRHSPGQGKNQRRGCGSRGHGWSLHHGSQRKVGSSPPKSRGEFVFIVNKYAKGLKHLRHVREEEGSKLLVLKRTASTLLHSSKKVTY